MRVYTIGHSNHPLPSFITLLARHRVDWLADVRSVPWSRHWPQYRQAALRSGLATAAIHYVFLGHELGARRDDPQYLVDGRADYERIAASATFQAGLIHLRALASRHRVAIMCAERAPLDCHRGVLVARRLAAVGVDVQHILADGSLQAHAETEQALLESLDLDEPDLFTPGREERLQAAYRQRGIELAFRPSRPRDGD